MAAIDELSALGAGHHHASAAATFAVNGGSTIACSWAVCDTDPSVFPVRWKTPFLGTRLHVVISALAVPQEAISPAARITFCGGERLIAEDQL